MAEPKRLVFRHKLDLPDWVWCPNSRGYTSREHMWAAGLYEPQGLDPRTMGWVEFPAERERLEEEVERCKDRLTKAEALLAQIINQADTAAMRPDCDRTPETRRLLVDYCADLTDRRAPSWYVATITVETFDVPDDCVARLLIRELSELILSALLDRGFGHCNLGVKRDV